MIKSNFSNLFYLFTIVLISTAVCSYAVEENNPKSRNGPNRNESKLKELFKSGAFNAELFKKLAFESQVPAEKLAYARQAMVLSPTDTSIRKLLSDTKGEMSADQSPISLNQKKSWLDFLSTKSYLPFYYEDYLLIAFSLIAILTFFSSQKTNTLRYLTICILSYLFFNKVFVTYSRDGSIRIINTWSDVLKTEGIALTKFKAYASPEKSSQTTSIIETGDEVDVFSLKPANKDWIRVNLENGRSGWIEYNPRDLFVIIR